MERILWFVIAGSRGGHNRARILKALAQRPSNPHQLSEHLELNYKTVTHHLRLLERHELVVNAAEGSYGAPYFLTKLMEHYLPLLEEMMEVDTK